MKGMTQFTGKGYPKVPTVAVIAAPTRRGESCSVGFPTTRTTCQHQSTTTSTRQPSTSPLVPLPLGGPTSSTMAARSSLASRVAFINAFLRYPPSVSCCPCPCHWHLPARNWRAMESWRNQSSFLPICIETAMAFCHTLTVCTKWVFSFLNTVWINQISCTLGKLWCPSVWGCRKWWSLFTYPQGR